MKRLGGTDSKLVLIVVVLIVASLVRLYGVDLRPLHHDEGVNFHFIREVFSKGYYNYSHQNYHGPFYFYLASLARLIYGDSILAVRLTSIIAGVGLCFLPFMFSQAKFFTKIFSSLLLAVSPSLLFHSRYAIHEMVFVALTVWFGISVYQLFVTNRAAYIYHIAVSLALLIATKETFIIGGFAIFVAMLSTFGFIRSKNLVLEHNRHLIKGFIIFAVILLGTFSAGFRWFDGIREMVLAVPQWIGRNESDTGHFKPALYYSEMILSTEPWLFVVPIILILTAIAQQLFNCRSNLILKDPLAKFLSVWAVTVTVVYGYVKYKTPWLIINQTAPLILLTAYGITVSFAAYRRAIFIGSLLVTLSSIYSAYIYNIKIPYSSPNPYSYVHTSSGFLRMITDIEGYLRMIPKARIVVAINSYWPLPYYVRNFEKQVGYINDIKPDKARDNYDIMVLDKSVNWSNINWTRKYYRLSDVQESFVYYRIKR